MSLCDMDESLCEVQQDNSILSCCLNANCNLICILEVLLTVKMAAVWALTLFYRQAWT